MLYTVANEKITVTIDSLGGEMMSVQTRSDGCEYLWQGDPAYWKGRAFHLFPICGRLHEGRYTYRGKTYEMNIHGFVRSSQLKVETRSADSIVFSLSDSPETRRQYPFAFRYFVSYRLEEDTVHITYRVENPDDKPLIFTVGGHPGFQVPLEKGLTFEDYRVIFDRACRPEMLEFSEACLLTGGTRPFALQEDGSLALYHGLFDRDAVFLQNMGHAVTLRSSKGSKGVTVAWQDMNYLGLWHKPQSDAPYICLEPWMGIPSYDGKTDDLETKRDMVHLMPGGQFQTGFSVTLF